MLLGDPYWMYRSMTFTLTVRHNLNFIIIVPKKQYPLLLKEWAVFEDTPDRREYSFRSHAYPFMHWHFPSCVSLAVIVWKGYRSRVWPSSFPC